MNKLTELQALLNTRLSAELSSKEVHFTSDYEGVSIWEKGCEASLFKGLMDDFINLISTHQKVIFRAWPLVYTNGDGLINIRSRFGF